MWPNVWTTLEGEVRAAIGSAVLAIEHIGSTAVPGLPAKPIIDLDVAVAAEDMDLAISRLEAAGWRHQGDLGILGREAFEARPGLPAHHLYLCPAGSKEMQRHLAFRDRLRADAALAGQYAALKCRLAARATAMCDYVNGKSDFVESVLAGGLGSDS